MEVNPFLSRVIFALMGSKVKDYRQQIFSILEKIVAEQLRGCETFYDEVIALSFDLLHLSETKLSN